MQEADRILTSGNAPAHHPDGGTPKSVAPPDLRVEIYKGVWASFTGTSAALIAEGVLPADFTFPAGWSESRPFEPQGKLREFDNARVKRERLPGTGRSTALVDFWRVIVRVGRDRQPPFRSGRVEEAERLLREEAFMRSPAGQEQLTRYRAAQHDKTFQAAMNFRGLARAARAAS